MDSAAALVADDWNVSASRDARVRAARVQERIRITDLLAMAFADDPPTRWLYPDDEEYRRNFPEFVRAFGGDCVELGSASCVEGMSACALWLPPGESANEEALVEHVVWRIAPHRHDEVFALFEAIGRVHPLEPHWYLPIIGVEPAYQGNGLGSALLRHGLERCDRDCTPAYLEATRSENIRLYERHGFKPLEPIRIGSCPPITPMWRAASIPARRR